MIERLQTQTSKISEIVSGKLQILMTKTPKDVLRHITKQASNKRQQEEHLNRESLISPSCYEFETFNDIHLYPSNDTKL